MPDLELRIRQSDHADFSNLDAFYAAHSGAYLPTPDAQALFDAGEEGLLFLVDDPETKALHAVAGLFPLSACRTADGAEVQVYELAGMALNPTTVAGLTPLTLQDLLLACRTVSLARSEHTHVCVVSSVIAANIRSRESMERGGLRHAPSPGWMQSARRSWCAPGQSEVIDLVLAPEAVCQHARALLAFGDNPVLSRVHRTSNATERVFFDVDLQWFWDDRRLETLAAGIPPAWESQLPPTRLLGEAPDWVEFSPPSA